MKLRRQAKSLFTDVLCRLWAVGMGCTLLRERATGPAVQYADAVLQAARAASPEVCAVARALQRPAAPSGRCAKPQFHLELGSGRWRRPSTT